MKFFTKKFWDQIFCKLAETMLSVKVWVILLTFAYGAWLTKILIEAQAWAALSVVATIMTGIIAPTVMMREGFKISRLNRKAEKDRMLIEHHTSSFNMNVGNPNPMPMMQPMNPAMRMPPLTNPMPNQPQQPVAVSPKQAAAPQPNQVQGMLVEDDERDDFV